MDFEDDKPVKKVKYSLGDDLSKYSVDELKDLSVLITEEKHRVEAEIKSKQSSKDAADMFFKK